MRYYENFYQFSLRTTSRLPFYFVRRVSVCVVLAIKYTENTSDSLNIRLTRWRPDFYNYQSIDQCSLYQHHYRHRCRSQEFDEISISNGRSKEWKVDLVRFIRHWHWHQWWEIAFLSFNDSLCIWMSSFKNKLSVELTLQWPESNLIRTITI